MRETCTENCLLQVIPVYNPDLYIRLSIQDNTWG